MGAAVGGRVDESDPVQQALLALAALPPAARASLLGLVGGSRPRGKLLSEVCALYAATWETATWAPQMRATLAPALRHFEGKYADELTRADWLHHRDHVRAKETTIRKGPPSVYTRNQELKRWRQVYTWALIEGHVTTNPLAGIRAARGAKKHRETEPTKGDVAFLRSFCDPELWAFVCLGFSRGFRASEARRLEWRQVDLDQGVINLYAWQDKARKARVMRIASNVVAALRAIRPEIPGRYVFQSPITGSPVVASTLWRRFRAAVAAAQAADATKLLAAEGDVRMTFHDTRHGFTSRAARRSPLQVTAKLSRHSSLSALQRYIHVNDEDLEMAYEKLEEDERSGPKKAPGSSHAVKKVIDDLGS